MSIFHLCQWLESTGIGSAVRDSSWLFPVIEAIHVLGIIVLVGSTGLFDLRLLGTGFLRDQRASKVAEQVMPWVWGSFALMFITGVVMFSSEATRCYESWFFRLKLGLLLLAGLNAFYFPVWCVSPDFVDWDEVGTPHCLRGGAGSSVGFPAALGVYRICGARDCILLKSPSICETGFPFASATQEWRPLLRA